MPDLRSSRKIKKITKEKAKEVLVWLEEFCSRSLLCMNTLPNTFSSAADVNDRAGGCADKKPYLREAKEWNFIESFVIEGLIFCTVCGGKIPP